MKSKSKSRRLRAVLLLVTCLAAGFAWDVARPPAAQWSVAGAVSLIHVYQRTASPLLGLAGARCRFRPSCSAYAEAVIRRHGLLAGGWRTARRIARCGPWMPLGTVDLPD